VVNGDNDVIAYDSPPNSEPGMIRVRLDAKGRQIGPNAEVKDVVGGYIIVETDEIGQAVELSKGCPDFGSRWFVRSTSRANPLKTEMELTEHLFRHEWGRR
jgi:hypothetical protein